MNIIVSIAEMISRIALMSNESVLIVVFKKESFESLTKEMVGR